MQKVIKVKFRNSGRCYYFDALDFDIHNGMSVIVDTTHGDMLGTTFGEPTEMDETRLSTPLKPVVRIATDEDLSQMKYYASKENEALVICRSKIEARGLAMKLVDAEYAFNGSKLTFYFTAENRVDFRELLKDLTAVFKARIDLRQIGDRDEAKKCGGLGFCGRPVCCNTFLSEFTPVSIKMAKTQNLSLNPLKISGICGKLMCCLRYEQDAYEAMQNVMPGVGKEFMTPDGPGTVLENNVITETTKLKITLPDGTFDVRSYPFRELISANNAEGAECGACCGGCCSDSKHNDAADEEFQELGAEIAAKQSSREKRETRDKPRRNDRANEKGVEQASEDAAGEQRLAKKLPRRQPRPGFKHASVEDREADKPDAVGGKKRNPNSKAHRRFNNHPRRQNNFRNQRPKSGTPSGGSDGQ